MKGQSRRWCTAGLFTLLPVICAVGMGPLLSEVAKAVVGGKKPDEKDYPATVRFTGVISCTATIVGKRTVLVAAHCVESGKTYNIELGGKTPELVCTRHPQHKATGDCNDSTDKACTADIALCKTTTDLTGPKFEVVQTDRSKIKPEMSVVLLGFGCTSDGAVEFNDLHSGTSTLKRISKEGDNVKASDQYLWTLGGAHACGGDSGAGAFDKADKSSRFVIGVISRASAQSTQLVSTADKRIVDFMKDWGSKNTESPICGVQASATGCR